MTFAFSEYQLLVFIDTEFTDLMDPQLLSAGMVSLDGHELYVELDLDSETGRQRLRSASQFVRYEGVLDQWGAVPGAACSAEEMGLRCGQWLMEVSDRAARKAGPSVEIAFDYTTDYELLEFAIRDAGLWSRVRQFVRPVNVGVLVRTIEGELGAESCFKDMARRGLRRHHALADAHALRASYERAQLAVQANGRSA